MELVFLFKKPKEKALPFLWGPNPDTPIRKAGQTACCLLCGFGDVEGLAKSAESQSGTKSNSKQALCEAPGDLSGYTNIYILGFV